MKTEIRVIFVSSMNSPGAISLNPGIGPFKLRIEGQNKVLEFDNVVGFQLGPELTTGNEHEIDRLISEVENETNANNQKIAGQLIMLPKPRKKWPWRWFGIFSPPID